MCRFLHERAVKGDDVQRERETERKRSSVIE